MYAEEPAHIVTSGAFSLRENRPYHWSVVSKNSYYYESTLVAVDEITLIPVPDSTTSMNLYKVGDVHAMTGDWLPPLLTSAVQRKRDSYRAVIPQ
jgi:ABC-type oligopeptide transport system substrate-binding subunit